MIVGIDATVEDPEVSFLIQNKYHAVKQVNQVKFSEPFVVCVVCCRSLFPCIPSLVVRAKFTGAFIPGRDIFGPLKKVLSPNCPIWMEKTPPSFSINPISLQIGHLNAIPGTYSCKFCSPPYILLQYNTVPVYSKCWYFRGKITSKKWDLTFSSFGAFFEFFESDFLGKITFGGKFTKTGQNFKS